MKNEEQDAALVVLGLPVALLLLTLAAAPFALLNGLVLKIMWGWFAVPLGLEQISFIHAVGLSFLIRFATANMATAKPKTDWGYTITTAIFTPLMILFLGWIVSWFMP
jgi:hypothetical protein